MAVKTLRTTSLPVLGAIACGLGLGIGITFLTLKKQHLQVAHASNFVKTALHIAKDQPEIKDILGEKFEPGPPSLNDGWSKVGMERVRIMLPITGDQEKAQLYIHARRKDQKERMKLYKLEMTFNKVAGRKLIILDMEDKDDAELPEISFEETKPKKVEKPRLVANPKFKGDLPRGPLVNVSQVIDSSKTGNQ